MTVGALSLSITLMAFSGISSSCYSVSVSLFHSLTEGLAVFPLAVWKVLVLTAMKKRLGYNCLICAKHIVNSLSNWHGFGVAFMVHISNIQQYKK